jgi:NADPH-dependent glutamate synthase beta subunit-like oxidoreductase
VAALADIFRVSSAHEEGGDGYAVSTERFTGDSSGRVTTLHAKQVEVGASAAVWKSRSSTAATSRSTPTCPAGHGFVGPERAGMLDALGVKITERGNVWRDARLDDERPGRVHRRRHAARPVAHRLGDRRGAAARAVDIYLMGSSNLRHRCGRSSTFERMWRGGSEHSTPHTRALRERDAVEHSRIRGDAETMASGIGRTTPAV